MHRQQTVLVRPEAPEQQAVILHRAAGRSFPRDDAPPVVLSWRFKHDEFTALALENLRQASPWLDNFARSAATEYPLYAQPVLLKVSEAALREASLVRHGPAHVESGPQAPLPDDTSKVQSPPLPVVQPWVECPIPRSAGNKSAAGGRDAAVGPTPSKRARS